MPIAKRYIFYKFCRWFESERSLKTQNLFQSKTECRIPCRKKFIKNGIKSAKRKKMNNQRTITICKFTNNNKQIEFAHIYFNCNIEYIFNQSNDWNVGYSSWNKKKKII